MKNIIVQKFGGTSMADKERIGVAGEIIINELKKGKQVIVVVSAMAGTTNHLLNQANMFGALSATEQLAEYDAIVSSGENIAAGLLSLYLQTQNIPARSIQGWQVGLLTDNKHREARCLELRTDMLLHMLEQKIVPVITGFQGISNSGRITTLGKGGSDTSAALIAAKLKSPCHIYTDVEGIYSADPRRVEKAKPILHLPSELAVSLCENGAKVLHPRAAELALRYQFPLKILSSFNTEAPGTTLTENIEMEESQFIAITSDNNILSLDILTDDEQKLKKALFDEELDILAFNRRSEGEYIVTTNLANYASVQKMLQAWQENGVIRAYTANTAIVKIALIGYRLKTHERLFKTLATVGEFSKVYQLELSERQVILIVPEEDSNKVMNYLHKELIEKQN